ncbi:SRPBCC domain-containing protein [Kitasatospora misakiensis]|uniref:SRPBCC domain-containing protein n=1 Tax=Kitasatospora misakiensis TaxID=67330 RepID=A0ABW0X0T8_9ACTN
MVADGIAREITIAAPRERVWEVLTQPEFLGTWFGTGTPAQIDLRPGGHITADDGTHGVAGAAGVAGTLPALIEQVEPPTLLAFRWSQDATGEHPTEANATLITFTLATEPGNHTRLTVLESGFAALALPPDEARTRLDQNGTGWTRKLTELACYTERLMIRKRG